MHFDPGAFRQLTSSTARLSISWSGNQPRKLAPTAAKGSGAPAVHNPSVTCVPMQVGCSDQLATGTLRFTGVIVMSTCRLFCLSGWKECVKVYQPDCVMQTCGGLGGTGLCALAPLRCEFVEASTT